MNNLLPFILSFLIPGLGQIYIKKYKKGIIILSISIIVGLMIPVIPFYYVYIICMIWSLVDIYLTLEKIEGKDKAIRNLIFSLIIVIIIIPSIFYLFILSIKIGGEYVKYEFFVLKNTKNEMKEISVELDRYFDYYKKFPSDFRSFVRSKPIWSGWESDSWENDYRYIQKDSIHYLLISSGKDCKFDTDDDLKTESR